MAFCGKCGSKLPEGAATCPRCSNVVKQRKQNNAEEELSYKPRLEPQSKPQAEHQPSSKPTKLNQEPIEQTNPSSVQSGQTSSVERRAGASESPKRRVGFWTVCISAVVCAGVLLFWHQTRVKREPVKQVSAVVKRTDESTDVAKEENQADEAVAASSYEEYTQNKTVFDSKNTELVAADSTEWDLDGRFAGGQGTQESPYLVANAQQLDNVREEMSAFFFQVCDIDLNGQAFQPIGTATFSQKKWQTGNAFAGKYDGGGHEVQGLSVSANEMTVGLFGALGPDGSVENLSVIGRVETTAGGSNQVAGGIAGFNGGVISRCDADVSIMTDAKYGASGGIAGIGDGKIDLSTSKGSVNSYGVLAKAGGIVGVLLPGGQVSSCVSDADVFSAYDAGGIAGWNEATILDCRTACVISATRNANGMAGKNSGQVQGGVDESSCSQTATVVAATNKPTVETVVHDGLFDKNGFVFANSSKKRLTRTQIYALGEHGSEELSFQDVLGFARNEIFARHGNSFKKEIYQNHYNQYSWYRKLKKRVVTYADFNSIEIDNVELIKEIEAEN